VGDLDLIVDPGVFDPQGVTIRAIDLAEELLEGDAPRAIIDIGTGSGAVAIAAAKRWCFAEIHGSDVSIRAVRCAVRNADRLGVRVAFHAGRLLDPMPPSLVGRVDAAFSNVPYVSPAGGKGNMGFDVPLATIYGPGADGLGLMRDLARELPRFLRPGGLWVFQIGDSQLEPWAAHLSATGFEPILPSVRRPGMAAIAAARWNGSPG
jgi:release factor glutamine methyltransferase